MHTKPEGRPPQPTQAHHSFTQSGGSSVDSEISMSSSRTNALPGAPAPAPSGAAGDSGDSFAFRFTAAGDPSAR